MGQTLQLILARHSNSAKWSFITSTKDRFLLEDVIDSLVNVDSDVNYDNVVNVYSGVDVDKAVNVYSGDNVDKVANVDNAKVDNVLNFSNVANVFNVDNGVVLLYVEQSVCNVEKHCNTKDRKSVV